MSKFSKRIKQSWKCLLHGPAPTSEPVDLFTLLNMAWAGQAVFVATKFGIVDHLANGPKSVAELARLTGAGEAHVHQLMRALASWEVFARDESGRYRLTPLSEPLVTERSSWLRYYVLIWGEQYYPAAGQMLEMMRSGRTGYELAHGEPAWKHTKIAPETLKLFVDFMSSVTDTQCEAVAAAFDFTPYRSVVDVGGGRASLISAVLLANPHLRGTIVDLPYMEEPAGERISRSNLADRCTFAGGSFLESVPAGADVYMIKHVLHDWSDTEVPKILGNISAAMTGESVLIIVEGVLDDSDGADRVLKLQDLERMFLTGGKGRTRGEFESLLQGAGLQLQEIRRTASPDSCLLIARKRR